MAAENGQVKITKSKLKTRKNNSPHKDLPQTKTKPQTGKGGLAQSQYATASISTTPKAKTSIAENNTKSKSQHAEPPSPTTTQTPSVPAKEPKAQLPTDNAKSERPIEPHRINETTNSDSAKPQKVLEDSDEEMIIIEDPDVIAEINKTITKDREVTVLNVQPTAQFVSPGTDASYSPTTLAGLILDTNFLISNLSLVTDLAKVADTYGFVIVVPWVVLQELDSLKLNHKKTNVTADGQKMSVAVLARKATDWIYRALANLDRRVVGQKLTENCSPRSDLHGDDGILDCCMYFRKNRQLLTVILSNDRNLLTKALIHEIKTVTYVKGLTADAIGEVIQREALSRTQTFDGDVDMEMDDAYDDQEPSKEQHDITSVRSALMTSMNSLSALRDTIVSIVVNELALSVKACLEHEYSEPEEYDRYVRNVNINNLKDLALTMNTFSVAVFSDYIKRRVDFKSRELSNVPNPDVQELLQFVNAWGGIWRDIRAHGPRSLEFVQTVIDDMTTSITSFTPL